MDFSLLHLMPNIYVILVSPLRRSLQTAYLIFKDHPNFKDILVIVDPHLREQMLSASDVP